MASSVNAARPRTVSVSPSVHAIERQRPARAFALFAGDRQAHGRCRQRDVRTACEEFAAAQRAIEREQRRARCIEDAVIEVERAVEVVGGDRRVGGFEFDLRGLQAAGDAQRAFRRRGDVDASIQRAALQACVGPALRQQALRPGDRDAGEVDAREVGGRGAALRPPSWRGLVASVPDRPASSNAMPSRKVCLPARSSPSQPQPWASMRRSGQVHARLRASIPRSGDCRRAVCRRRLPSGALAGQSSCTWTPSSVAIGNVIFAMSASSVRAFAWPAKARRKDEEERARHWGGRIAGSRELYPPRARFARSIPWKGDEGRGGLQSPPWIPNLFAPGTWP